VGSDGRRGDENDDGPSRGGHSELVPKAGAPGDRPRIPGVRQELSTIGQPGIPGPTPGEGPRPFPTAITPPATPVVPQPRGDEPGPSVAGGRGRVLRRRVPQSHLAPELRHVTNGGLADTGAPLSANAAATALSRYQASRLAAQAVVDVAGESSSREEGDRK
jgi:hypothetical protein